MIDALDQAAYETVRDYRTSDGGRGAAALAPRVGMKAGTLRNKVYIDHDSQLTLRESIPIQRTTGNFAILSTYAACLDHAVIPVGDFSGTSDVELLELYCNYHTELGQTAAALCDAVKSGRISTDQFVTLQREMLEDIQAGMALLARVKSLTEPSHA